MKRMKIFKMLSLVMVLAIALGSVGFAANEVFEATIPGYKVIVDGVEQTGLMYNIGGYTFMKARPFTELLGGTVEWDDAKKEAKFNSKVVTTPEPQVITEVLSLDWREIQKQVVRIAIPAKENDKTFTTVKGQRFEVVGNGFFTAGRKIVSTIDTYDAYRNYIGNVPVGTDTGDQNDTTDSTTVDNKIKVILWDDTIIDAKNFRTDDDRIMGLIDTMGYTSKNIVKFAASDLKVGEMSVMCTSITSNTENSMNVPNQFSFGEVLRTSYPRDNQHFTLISNNTDMADSGRAGAVFNASGELAGIFNDYEDGNNGNCLVTPQSVIKAFLND